jgi:hypothetical protein
MNPTLKKRNTPAKLGRRQNRMEITRELDSIAENDPNAAHGMLRLLLPHVSTANLSRLFLQVKAFGHSGKAHG